MRRSVIGFYDKTEIRFTYPPENTVRHDHRRGVARSWHRFDDGDLFHLQSNDIEAVAGRGSGWTGESVGAWSEARFTILQRCG